MKTKYIVLGVLGILFFSCEKVYYWEYIVQNDTSSIVLIEGFNRYNLNGNRVESIDYETIEIKPNESFSVRSSQGFHPDPEGIFDNFEIDSVNIIFDNKRIIVQACDEHPLRVCDVDRNIVAYETEYVREKTGRSSNENEYRFTYTITEEDYNNAVQINE